MVFSTQQTIWPEEAGKALCEVEDLRHTLLGTHIDFTG